MSLSNSFERRTKRALCNICREHGYEMHKIKGKRHVWLVVDSKGRHHAMVWKISYEKGSGYFVVRFPEGDPGNYGPARLSLRSDSDIAQFGMVIMAISQLRARRRQ